MSNNTTSQKTTFWNFLKNNTIEIPIIQRDYAQGRKGKEELRKTFLTSLKNALDKKQELTLDFVYGSTSENNRLNPIDGQQRLTTLWLLHWYVAYKADKLDSIDKENAENNEQKNPLKSNFTYETRVSSREFCEKLAEFKTQKPNNSSGTISDFIQQQTWFYSAWKQDPTIQSMLRMLSGTSNKDKNGQEIVDGLEELFSNSTKAQFDKYWEILTEHGDNKCPINFYNLNLGELKLSDDLYIKMNARGEQLTSFENFKADLIGHISEQKNGKKLDDKEKEQWEKFLDPTNGIPIKMDTTWTYIFWKNKFIDEKTNEVKIDDIYFAFLNRFFLNEFICKKNSDNSNYDKTVKDIEADPTFELLYGTESNDSKIIYHSFEKYKACVTKESLNSLQKMLNNFAKFVENKDLKEINQKFQHNWCKNEKEKDFVFIPDYEDKSITTLTQPQRVIFYAICKYFEKECNYEYESIETSLKQWMRVVWNLVENGNIETIDSMIGNIRLIDELSAHSYDIYKFLSDDNSKIASNANKEQLQEEIEKAKKITEAATWEDVFVKAESHELLKGKIAVLFSSIDQPEKLKTKDEFNKRLELLKNIQKQGQANKDSYFLQKILVLYFQNGKINFNLSNTVQSKKILLTKDLSSAFRAIPSAIPAELSSDILADSWQKDIATTNLLNNSRGKKISSYQKYTVLWGTEGCKWSVFGNDVWGNVILANPRNAILSDFCEKVKKGSTLSEHKITSSCKIDNSPFFSDWDVYFEYCVKEGEKYNFSWCGDDCIYLLDKENNYLKDKNGKDIKTDATKITSDNFIEILDSLILEKQ